MRTQRTDYSNSTVTVYKTFFPRIIVSTIQIIQPCFLIEYIPPIAERISLAEGINEYASSAQHLTPRIIFVFYHENSSIVKNSYNVSLKIMQIRVHCAVEFHFRRAVLRIVEEMQLILMCHFTKISIIYRHMRKNLPVVSIIRRFRMPRLFYNLLHTHAIVIILKRYANVFRTHLFQLTASQPCVRPCAVVQRIANCVVGNRFDRRS